jgi:hypothetical protein
VQWAFVPLVSVGPLRFGTDHDEVGVALRSDAPGTRIEPLQSGGIWDEAEHTDVDVIVYYDGYGLCCVAVDGRRVPQVTFEGTALTGRAPSAIEQWMHDQRRLGGRELRYTHAGDPEPADIGLICRPQRAGDVLVSRPVFLRQRAEVTWDEVPGGEWRIR